MREKVKSFPRKGFLFSCIFVQILKIQCKYICMEKENENRTVKDSLFVDYFSKDAVVGKKNFIELYNCISGNSLSPEDTVLEDVKIEQVIYKSFCNDISMLVNGKLVVLLEHQSSVNENMPLRFLIYCSRIYERIVDSRLKFSTERKMIPSPEFYVIYNGSRNYPPQKILRLSDSFIDKKAGSEVPLELNVKVFNIKHPECTLDFSSCKPLDNYVKFISLVEEEKSSGASDFMTRAVLKAQKQNLLPDYLRRKASEVISMVFNEYDYETDIQVKTEEAERRGHAAGLEEGTRNARIETARNALRLSLSVEQVSQISGLSEEEILKIK
ncbi:hypothetical protein DYE49_08780 [Treponema rectale]|uniref:Transposase (putative) YhgA-like domain-containing protein n=2 Tax=Treponema rectale TaxID=744512 RepID=A0A7M1XNY3_9SPIR|nr:hypothetical protein DYE49_08780 [Treponema rectale]